MTYIIAEIGINHNGNIDLAKSLIKSSAAAGCEAFKFQKRTAVIVCVNLFNIKVVTIKYYFCNCFLITVLIIPLFN